MQIKYGNHEYDIGKMSLFDQLHVTRKLASVIIFLNQPVIDDGLPPVEERFARAMVALTSPLTRDDIESAVALCLAAVKRKNDVGVGWAPVWNDQAGMPMFDDIDLLTMGVLVFYVMERHKLRQVFDAPPRVSGGQAAGQET